MNYKENHYFNNIIKIINYLKFIFILIFVFFFIYNKRFITELKNDRYYFKELINKTINNNEISFEYNNLTYSFSYKYNIVEIHYNIYFYNKDNILIRPSDLTLFNNLHILCYVKYESNSISVESLANIIQNNHYNCIEFFKIKENIQFGIKIYFENNYNTIIFFNNNKIRYSHKFINNTKFNTNYLYNIYINNLKIINRTSNFSNNFYNLKYFYIKKPYLLNKNNEIFQNDIWSFKNIYNKYFCFCKGSCKYSNISQLCKYQFYLYIIDNNKYLYKKTDYLFSDFYQTSSDDTYPIFKEMIKKNISAHYIDKKKEIYQKYCKKKKVCTKVINSFNTKLLLNGDFLEKYLELILRLKAVVVGHKITSFYNILYCIDYIEYINLGHGIKYIKHFLYNDYSSHTKYNKLVLPPSTKIIKMAIKYGWNEKNIIKNCLPKWDKYDIYKNNLKLMNKNKSIFILFTWRCLKKENLNISSMYLNNIRDLVNNIILNKIIRKNNITLYFTLHPNFKKYNRVFKFNKSIKYISHKNISNCLMESNLLITDFSSVIFDIIYQKKPYIMFIPDAEDKNIKYIYQKGYYEIIDSLKNRSLYFENTFFDVNKTLIKIIYYIEHHFKLDDKLKKFYDSFQFKCGNNTDKFINYLIGL